MEGRSAQYIPVEFEFLDSTLFREWDSRGYKLYLHMRRHIWRGASGRLAGYYQNGWLAADGYLGTWAHWLGISRSEVSRLLAWMESKCIIRRLYKSETAGHPNIYAIGEVEHIIGGKPKEVIYLQHLLTEEADHSLEPLDEPPSLAHESVGPEHLLTYTSRPQLPTTVAVRQHSVAGGGHSVAGGQRSNNRIVIVEENKDHCDGNTVAIPESLSPETELDSTSSENVEPTPSLMPNCDIQEPAAPCEDLHKPKRPRVDAGEPSLLAPRTIGAALFFEVLGREAAAKGFIGPRQFKSLALRDKFEAAETRLGPERLVEVIQAGLATMGYAGMPKLVAYIVKAAGNGAPALANLDPVLYQKVVEAMRLDPAVSTQHRDQAARVTEACMKGGYTAEEVRKAGRYWWKDDWRGKAATGPNDGQFIQLMRSVREEKM